MVAGGRTSRGRPRKGPESREKEEAAHPGTEHGHRKEPHGHDACSCHHDHVPSDNGHDHSSAHENENEHDHDHDPGDHGGHESRAGKEGHGHDHSPRSLERKALTASIVITLAGFFLEVIGGLVTRSLALISDAGHMFTHLLSLGISLGAIMIATGINSQETRERRTFGLFRLEILGALFNAGLILLMVALIFYTAWRRFVEPEEVESGGMLAVAAIGLAVNIIVAFILNKTAWKENLNIKSAFYHMLSDLISSVGVLAAAGGIALTGWNWLDPLASVIIGFMILVWSVKLIKETSSVLLESVPGNVNVKEVEDGLKALDGRIVEVHDIHIWEITSSMNAMTAHLVVDDMPLHETNELRKRAERLLSHQGIDHATLQFECACSCTCEIEPDRH